MVIGLMVEVKSNQRVGNDYYLLKIRALELTGSIFPGQFVHLKIGRDNLSFDPLLRRPFSIHDLSDEKDIYLLYRVVGKGTRILTDYKTGDKLDLLGPLGQGFKLDFVSRKILIIGGGMGIAPLYFLAKRLAKQNLLKVLIGGKNKEEMEYFIARFRQADIEFAVATMDGSAGFQGTVVDLWQKDNTQPDYLFACGPEAMLREVQVIAQKKGIPGQVSLEERMACGIGVCLSCVHKTNKGNQRVCKEGPVFSLEEVVFDD